MAPASKLKAPSLMIQPPRDREQADSLIFEIGKAQRQRETIETSMNAELAKIKARYEALAEPVNRCIKAQMAALQFFCEQNREDLCGSGVKTVKFGNGEVSWRWRPPKVMIRSAAKVIAWCLDHALAGFVRVIHEVDKEAMLGDPVAARAVPGVTIASAGEDFIVKPFESKLEEIA